ncbi:DUF5403 family protein [Micromonospora sp. NPDC049240]|uniref:DUF5403 family protein n=1 Tax=Micromonospora sp. NPDC049240 TaxID=3155151 RepID=UPI00340FD7FA
MADVVLYKGLERRMAKLDGVQDYLDELVFAMKAKADADLVLHRQDGHAAIEVDEGRIDRYLVLSDERGEKAALSIEFGRAGYIDPETGEVWGEMEGLHILANATGIPRKGRKTRRETRPKPRRDPKTGKFFTVKTKKRR